MTPTATRSDPTPRSAIQWRESFVQSYGRTLVHLAERWEVPVSEVVAELLAGVPGSCNHPELARGLVQLGFGRGSGWVEFNTNGQERCT